MKKFLIFFICLKLLANNYEKALEYEKNGEYKKAMQIYKNLALKNAKFIEKTQSKNTSILDKNITKITAKTSPKNELLKDENNANLNQKSPMQLGLANYLGEEQNPLGISSYKMNYFLPFSHSFNALKNSDNQNEAKFQISLKKLLFEDLLGLNERYYFAYTQTSWWQIYERSAPFRESNYQPEVFVDLPINASNFSALNNLRIGFLHESNGLGDDSLNSRSWNRIYLSSSFKRGDFVLIPRVWLRVPESEDDNPNITHYLGNFDVNLAYLGNKFFINTMLRNNLNFKRNKGAIELNLGYDLFGNGIFYYAQFFSGYGESLLSYDKHSKRLSIGVLVAY